MLSARAACLGRVAAWSHLEPSLLWAQKRFYSAKTAPKKEVCDMVTNIDGVKRPRSTAAFKRMQMEYWRQQNSKINEVAKQSGLKNPWSYKMSLILVRPLIIAPELEPWEVEYKQWKEKWDAPLKAQIPPWEDLMVEDPSAKDEKALDASKMDAEALERMKRAEEIKAAAEEQVVVKVGSRITEADKTNNRKSLRRALAEKLYFIVKKNRSDHSWQFPQAPLPLEVDHEQKNLRDIAGDGVHVATGKNVDIHMTGNAPCGYYTYAYNPELQKSLSTYGAKLFFYRGYYVKGDVKLPSRYVDHAWVTKEELKDYIQDPILYKYLDGILL